MKALIVASLASYSTTAVPLTDVTIREAIQAWFADSVNATTMYGPISTWDTSLVTNMDSLFDSDLLDTRSFNEDLSSWNTSLVTSMAWMFYGASSFNCKNLSTWDTRTVENMSGMFASASSFQGDVVLWDTSRVTSMYAMFFNASSFHGNLSHWDTSSVTDISFMFASASDFNGNVSTWDTSKVVDMDAMFHRASSFNHDISYWKTSKVVKMNLAFSSALSFYQTLCWDTSLAVTDRFDGGVPFASRSEWAPCSTSSQCANGCCSSVWSGGVLKCTPVGGFKSDIGVGQGDWTSCLTSSKCANGCCSSLYSEGVLKCTPMGGFHINMCVVDVGHALKLLDWVPCDKSYACSSGCCSGLYSGGVPKCTPVIGGFNPDICMGGSPTTKYGDWVQYSSSSQCNNYCCSGLYSGGELKCTPLLEGFNPIDNGCVGGIHTTKHADWTSCSSSSECKNGCCSGAWSGGELKCTPVGGFDSRICIVGSNPFSGSHGSFSTTPYPSCRSVQSAVPPHTFFPSMFPTKKSTPKPTITRVISPTSSTSVDTLPPSFISSDLHKCKSSSSGNYGIVTKNRAFISYNYQMQVLSNRNLSELVLPSLLVSTFEKVYRNISVGFEIRRLLLP